jgi:hypothetical protein
MTVDSQTKVSLFAVLGALPLLVGGLVWLTSIDAKASSAEVSALKNAETLDRQLNLLLEMREKLARIEEQLKRR